MTRAIWSTMSESALNIRHLFWIYGCVCGRAGNNIDFSIGGNLRALSRCAPGSEFPRMRPVESRSVLSAHYLGHRVTTESFPSRNEKCDPMRCNKCGRGLRGRRAVNVFQLGRLRASFQASSLQARRELDTWKRVYVLPYLIDTEAHILAIRSHKVLTLRL